MAQKLRTLSLTIAISMPLLAPVTVLAQDADTGALEEVVVYGIRQSLDNAADIKRNSDSIVDAITAQDIGLFSDNNMGEALQRVPGVQLERSEGEGFRISIRGLGPRFVRTTLNGRTALSSPGGEGGSDARGFSFNIIPSEVISGARVIKSTQAMDVEGGIGGVVDLQTTRPLDLAADQEMDFYVGGSLRGTLNDLEDKNSTRGSLLLNSKVNDNFGVFFAAAIDRTDRVQESAESQDMDIQDFRLDEGTLLNGEAMTEALCGQLSFEWNAGRSDCDLGEGPAESGVGIFDGNRSIIRDRERDRNTFTGGLQWQPSDNWEVYVDWTHGDEEESREDFRYWQRTEFGLGRLDRSDSPTSITDITINFDDADEFSDGTVTAFSFENMTEDSVRQTVDVGNLLIDSDTTVDVGGINVKWSNDDWTVRTDFGYASQEEKFLQRRVQADVDFSPNSDPARFPLWPDRRDDTTIPFVGINGSFDINSGVPIVMFEDVNGVPLDPTDPTDLNFDQDRQGFIIEDNSEMSFRLDVEKALDTGFLDRVNFGYAYRDRDGLRSELRTSGDCCSGGNQSNYLDLGIEQFGTQLITGFMNDINDPNFNHSFVVPDIHAWLEADPVGTFAVAPRDGIPRQDREYEVEDQIEAFYLQASFSGGDRVPFRGNFGVRYAETRQTSIGLLGVQDGDNFVPLDPNNPVAGTDLKYDDTLPSFNIAFDFTDELVFRLAASKTVTRPDPVDLRQGWDLDDIDGSDNEGDAGNPDLDPYRTDNYDMSLEWYPESGGAYAIGVFYKELDGFIADGEEIVPIDLSPFDPALGVQDFEIERPVNTEGGDIFGYELSLHTPFDSFTDGFWRHFGINASFTYVDAELDAVRGSGRIVSLRGTSEWSGNIVAYFEKGPFAARVAYNDRDDFLHQEAVSSNDFDEFTEGAEYVTLNLDYRFNENWQLRFTGNNLSDSQRFQVWGAAGSDYFSDQRNDGRTYVLELRGRM
jgi:TonB-dependent receptor